MTEINLKELTGGMSLEAIAQALQNSGISEEQARDIAAEQIANSELVSSALQGFISYETKSDMDAAGAPSSGELAIVWSDSIPDNNGYYGWNSSAWEKSKLRQKEAIPNGPCHYDVSGNVNGLYVQGIADGTWTIRVYGSYILDGLRYSVGVAGTPVVVSCAAGDKYVIATSSGVSCVSSLPATSHAVLALLGMNQWASTIPHYKITADQLTGLPDNTSTTYPPAVWDGQGWNDVSADDQNYLIVNLPRVDMPDAVAAINHLKNDFVTPDDVRPEWLMLDGDINAYDPPFMAPVPRVKSSSAFNLFDEKDQYDLTDFAYDATNDTGFNGKLKSDQNIYLTGLLDRAINFNHLNLPDGFTINSFTQDAGFPPELEIYRAGLFKNGPRLRLWNEETLVTFAGTGNDLLDGKTWKLQKVARGSNESYISGVSIPSGGSMLTTFAPGRSNTTGTVSVKFKTGYAAPLVEILDSSDSVIASSSIVTSNVIQVAYTNPTSQTKIRISDSTGTSVATKVAHYYDRTDYTKLYLFRDDEDGFTLSGGATYVSSTQPTAYNNTLTASLVPVDDRDFSLTLAGGEDAGTVAPIVNVIAEDIILERAFGGQDASATLGTTMFANGDLGVSFKIGRCITNSYRDRSDGLLAGNWKFETATTVPRTYEINGMDCSSIADNLPEGNGLKASNVYCAFSKMLQFMDGRGSHADLIQGFSGSSGGREDISYYNLWLHQEPFESGNQLWFDPNLYPDFDTTNNEGSKAGPNSALFFVKKDAPFFRNVTMIKGLSYGGSYPLRLSKLAAGAIYENIVVKDWFLFGNPHKYYSISANAAGNDVVTGADLDIREWDVRCAQTGLRLPSPSVVADNQAVAGNYRTLRTIDICGHTDWNPI